MTATELRNESRRWLGRRFLLPAGDLIFRQGLMEHLKFLEEAQWWPRERLAGWRNQALQTLVRTAYCEVPFYRALMDNSGVTWRDITSVEDLRKIPIVNKPMLRAGYPHLTTRDTGQSRYETSSSGSTGANFFVMEDARTAGRYRAAFLLALEWAGWSLGERHLQTGMTLDRSWDRRLKDALLRCHYISAFDLSDTHLDRTLDVLEGYSIRHLWGYPSSLYFLALRARARGWNHPMQSMVTWGDNLYPHYRAAIESAFQARVFDTYGCGEGIQIAAQCGHGSHYHVFSTETIVEYVDDEGQPAPPRGTANVIVTRLHPGPMPLIRYRIGDLGIAANGDACSCGRGLEIMQSIQGRDGDVILTPAGNRLIVHFFTGILEHYRDIGCFQVVQHARDAALVRIVPARGRALTREVAAAIIRDLEDKGMAGMHIDVEPVSEIPVAPSGKRRFVICELPRERRPMEMSSGR